MMDVLSFPSVECFLFIIQVNVEADKQTESK